MTTLLSVKQMAIFLGVGKQTVYRMVADREIPYHAIRGQYKFDEQEIKNWLGEQNVETKKTP